MSFSRMPENRRGSSLGLVGLAIIVVVAAAAAIVYFTIGFGPNFSQAASPEGEKGTGSTTLAVTNPLGALPVSQQAPPPVAEMVLKSERKQSTPASPPIPSVNYGEVLSEGFVSLDLPGGASRDAWYTFQVNTSTREIALFFALYNETKDTIVKTVEVAGYTQGELINNARITMFYPEGPERYLSFDATAGTIGLSQRHGQPFGPSMFTPELRVALVNYGVVLGDESGSIRADLHLDLTGLSDSESFMLAQSNPEVVNRVMVEVQGLVDQINARRPKE